MGPGRRNLGSGFACWLSSKGAHDGCNRSRVHGQACKIGFPSEVSRKSPTPPEAGEVVRCWQKRKAIENGGSRGWWSLGDGM